MVYMYFVIRKFKIIVKNNPKGSTEGFVSCPHTYPYTKFWRCEEILKQHEGVMF